MARNQIPDTPNELHAALLIALALADGELAPAEKEMLDSILGSLKITQDVQTEMLRAPYTLDAIAGILAETGDVWFKRRLLRDCYLLAYADEEVAPNESRFIQRISLVMAIEEEVAEQIHASVRETRRLFHPSPRRNDPSV